MIDTWNDFKRELKSQFLPKNVEYLVHKELKRLRHDKSIQEYVRNFIALMLDIMKMTEEDRLFYFMDGL